jgi:hypothetical protein
MLLAANGREKAESEELGCEEYRKPKQRESVKSCPYQAINRFQR